MMDGSSRSGVGVLFVTVKNVPRMEQVNVIDMFAVVDE